MKLDTVRDYSLDMNKYGDLFSEKINPETIQSLKKTASQGDLNSIELLSNLALRQDEHGRHAENILFNLFISTAHSNKNHNVTKKIQDASLALYRLSINGRMQNNTDMHKLQTASRLLYMAGPTASSDEKKSLSRIFTEESNAYSPFEEFDEDDIWDPARKMTTDEVNTAIKLCTRRYNTPEINFPIGLINPHNQENILSLQIKDMKESPGFLSEPEFFPINTGDHWIVFGVYQTAHDATPQAIIFNSANPLSPEIKNHIIDAAITAGVTPPDNILFLEQNIQEHVPNGCGLFTIEAMKRLMENDFQSPIDVLETLLSSFNQLSVEEQTRYNLQNRYQIYAETYLP